MPDFRLPPEHLSSAAREAWDHSFFGTRMPPTVASILTDAHEVRVSAGDIVHRVSPAQGPMLCLVLDGLLRIFTASGQGRQATVRYVAAGDVFGLPTVLAPTVMEEHLHLAFQGLTDAHLLRLPPDRFLAAIRRAPEAQQAIYDELTRVLLDSYVLLTQAVFQPVRQRVARHLLDMAVREEGRFIVRAKQQEIADSVGSVREVVARALVALRDEGAIERVGNGYAIRDPGHLHRLANQRS